MSEYLEDKVIAITGAASGFGRLIAMHAASRGALVVCGDVDEEGLAQTCASIEDAGHTALAQPVDVTDLGQMHELCAAAVSAFGALDVMVNNAGIMPLAFFADHEKAMDAWSRCIDINFKGVLHGIVCVHDQMLKQGRGHVVNLSSIYSNHPVVGAGVYGATKAAVNFLSESLRMESQGQIKVTNVRPTGVPGTSLATGVINPDAIVGILGHKAAAYGQLLQAHAAGELPAEHMDAEHMEYYALDPEYLAEQVLHAIDQPWGVSIGDITVRASGDAYIL